MNADDSRRHFAALLREQAGWCRRLGSPLYAHLLDEAADDTATGGPAWAILRGHEDDPPGSALVLRLMGAVHRLVLEGRLLDLRPLLPVRGRRCAVSGRVGRRFAPRSKNTATRSRLLLERPVQTNEVGRSAALVGGFLTVARATGLPLRCLEIGASAGLNLRWDHLRYEAEHAVWGDPAAPVCLRGFEGALPPLDVPARVVARAGCDTDPIDPSTDDGARTLRAYVWPDQEDRHALLAGALAIARRVPAAVERAEAEAWLARRLTEPFAGAATVVYHSITWQYLGPEARRSVRSLLEHAGKRATAHAPLAWLRFEPVTRAGPHHAGGADAAVDDPGLQSDGATEAGAARQRWRRRVTRCRVASGLRAPRAEAMAHPRPCSRPRILETGRTGSGTSWVQPGPKFLWPQVPPRARAPSDRSAIARCPTASGRRRPPTRRR